MNEETFEPIEAKDVKLLMPSTVEGWRRYVAKMTNLVGRSLNREMKLLEMLIDAHDHKGALEFRKIFIELEREHNKVHEVMIEKIFELKGKLDEKNEGE